MADIADTQQREGWNQQVLWGCAFAFVLTSLFGLSLILVALQRDRNIAHYPGASPVAAHSNYGGLPFQVRWDNSYFTTDNFTDVYHWYSVTFNLGAESRALERCILLEGPTDQILIERYLSVLLCNAPEGQYIYVTRTTRLKGN